MHSGLLFWKFRYKLVNFLLVVSTVLSLCHSALSQTETDQPLKGLTVICDLDYTFFDYESRRELHRIGRRNWLSESIHRLMSPPQIVPGMDELLLSLQKKGAEIVFLSARPEAHLPYMRKILNAAGFPKSAIRLAGYSVSSAGFKIDQIMDISRRQPEQKLILMGDNLDYDIIAFDRITADDATKSRVIATFVRTVRKSIPIPNRYFKFEDGAGIANILLAAGLLSASDVESMQNHAKSFVANICRNLFH